MFKKLTDATVNDIEREIRKRGKKTKFYFFFETMKFLLMLQRRSSCVQEMKT